MAPAEDVRENLRGLTVRVAGAVGDQQAGHSEAGAENTQSDTSMSHTGNKSNVTSRSPNKQTITCPAVAASVGRTCP